MLLEAMEYALVRAFGRTGALAARFGYVAEIVALGARRRRRRQDWAPHVAACRAFIREACAGAPVGGRALVAGSGRLIEIPLVALVERFSEIVLLDIVHPPSVRLAARRFGNVRLVEADATGVVAPLARALDDGRPLPDPAAAPRPFVGDRFDVALSANLLSQLPLMPMDALEARAPHVEEAERARFAHALLGAHVDWLKDVADVAALYTDMESAWIDRNGRIVEREDSLWGVSLPAPDRVWTWNIAPAPEQEPDRDLRHTVGAWLDLNGGRNDGVTPPPPRPPAP